MMVCASAADSEGVEGLAHHLLRSLDSCRPYTGKPLPLYCMWVDLGIQV
jgi:hypothetical protein